MKRKILFLILIICILVGVGVIVQVINSRSPKPGELRVDSVPAASVFLDNKHMGRTPYKDKVLSGEYTVKIVPESTVTQLTSWEGKVKVGPNLLTYVNANLSESELATAVDLLSLEKITSAKAEVSVVTNPDGATVLLDDESKGVTPLTISDVSVGDHSLTVTSPGFAARSLKVRVTAGYKVTASIKLALSSGVASAQATPEPTAPTPSGISEKPSPTPSGKPTPTKAANASPTPGPTAPDKPYVVIKDTPTGYLRVRLEPSTAATEVARVKPGEKYALMGEQSGWFQITYDPGDKGWISGQYASKIE